MRFIAVIVFLIVVAIAVGWFAFGKLDSFGQDSIMRWSTFVLIILLAILGCLCCCSYTLPDTESRYRARANRWFKRENKYHQRPLG